MGGHPPKPPWVNIISLLYVNLKDMWSCCVWLKHATLSEADGNITSTTRLY